jgi:DNA (cytosine-5)-methyltransferase 1
MTTYGSLFSGVGGFDMGFDQVGYECLFQVEWDKHCQQILVRHWPDVPRWSDVQDVNGAELPPCDVLTFGSPCQDLSIAGKQVGLDGGRSSMFFEATRIIREMRDATGNQYPRVVVWENVPGALSSNRGADFQAVIDEMADSGALVIEWAVLDAQHFGVPQRRRRIFLVAVLDPAIASRCPDPLLPVAEGRRGDTKKINQERERVTSPVGESTTGTQPFVKVTRPASNQHPEIWREEETCPTLNAFDNTGESRSTVIMLNFQGSKGNNLTNQDDISFTLNAMHGHDVHVVAQPIIFTAQRVGEPPRIYEDSTPSLLSRMGTGGNNVPMIAESIYSFDTQFGSNANVFEDQSPTLKASQQSPSISTNYAVRRLTPLECERLMGWPDDHTRYKADGTEQADTNRYRQCGNGVATPVARWVARQIMEVLG